MKLYVTDHDGNEHQIEGVDGWQLMEAIRDEGMQIKAECGGACACATCHVYVDAGGRESRRYHRRRFVGVLNRCEEFNRLVPDHAMETEKL